MECGVPFCHHGCPLGNLIPDWNDLVYRDRFEEAIEQLHRTNNFPEFTGRLCPAPCEAACVLEIDEGNAVTIKQIEVAIVNRGVGRGLDRPAAAAHAHRAQRRRRRLGAGRARVRAAAERAGPHGDRLRARRGGRRARPLRRARLQDREAARRAARAAARRRGRRVPVRRRRRRRRGRRRAARRATTRSCSRPASRVPRDLPVPGRELDGVHFAMEYLYERNRFVADAAPPERVISARRQARHRDRRRRHRRRLRRRTRTARRRRRSRRSSCSASRLRRAPTTITPWPRWPMKLRTSYALKEGGEREFAISTTRFTGERPRRRDPLGAERRRAAVRRSSPARRSRIPPSSSCWRWASSAPSRSCSSSSASSATRAAMRPRPRYATSVDGVFAAGDARRGQSLIVWAINEGRQCARAVDQWLARAAAA